MLKIGSYFKSKKSLIHCLSEVAYNSDTKTVDIDTKKLKPNTISPAGRLSTKVFVRNEGGKKLWADARNDDPSRTLSLWEVTEAKRLTTDNSDHSNMRARCLYKAKRVNVDGSVHESNETVTFFSSGIGAIEDLTPIQLPCRL